MTAHVLVKEEFLLSGVLSKQRAAFLRDGPPSAAQRKADLLKLKTAVLARRREFEQALNADFGNRSAYETRIMEVIPLVQSINYLRRNLKRWMRPEKRHVAVHFLPGRSRVVYQPLGVVGIMSPWNYSLSLALIPLATALAAGNRVMLKLSEMTPAINATMTQMLGDLFPEEQVAVVTGGPDVGQAFAGLRFDHLIFTGSTSVGRSVMKSAAQNLVPVTLELGGKSPVIIAEDAVIARAAARVAYGKLANAGQTCIAPDYVLIHEDHVEDFAKAYEAAVTKLYPGGTSSQTYTSIINPHHVARLRGLIEDARKKGARVIEISPGQAAPAETRKLAPAIVLHANDTMLLMQNEIFGPILPVVTYRDIDEAINFVNRRPRPLALYYFGGDGEARRKVLERTTSGDVTINDTLMHYVQNDLPFGGVGPSGLGAYHGHEGFKTLSHAKGVFEQARWNFGYLLRPPFRRTTGLAIRYLLW
jgi:coniferyl-aldehyde dehydrogenase